jgi:ABC-type transporter Mla subunit MlaD
MYDPDDRKNAQGSARPQPPVRPVSPPQRVMPGISAPAPVTAPKPPAIARPQRSDVLPAAPIANAFNWGALRLNESGAHQDISGEVSSLNSALNDLQQRSSFNDTASAVNDLDAAINDVLQLTESARTEGYWYQNDIENIVYQAKSQWDSVRPQLISQIQQQAHAIQNRLPSLYPQVQSLNNLLSNPAVATPLLQTTHTQVNTLLQSIDQAQRQLESLYKPIEGQVDKVKTRLTNIHWAMDQLTAACFKLVNGEDLVMAVAARWDKEGKEDPEGILYLSSRRLIFERKEKVATKKILFITTASQLVQELLIDQPLAGIQSVKGENKGLFGHQDFIQVQFNDPKFGMVPFHINGQDCMEWAGLIERSKSGAIENERAAAGGVSIADLTRPLTLADIASAQNEVNLLADEMMLKRSREELAGLENIVQSLKRTLGGLRARGYAIEKNLEADIDILGVQWDKVKANASATIDLQANQLADQLHSLQQTMAQLSGSSSNLAQARPVYLQLKSAIASGKAQAQAAQETAAGQYRLYAQEVDAIAAHLDWVGWMLDALSTASFRLLATEAGVAAAEAVWGQPGLEPENGILYLTDQRLIWEDRVGTFELKVNVPIQQVEEVDKESEEEGEALVFRFGPGAPLPNTRFLLRLPVADSWVKMVGRARNGDYAQDRAVELDPKELERVKNAPQQCSRCGASFTAPILRGQNEITCEYCGLVTRI